MNQKIHSNMFFLIYYDIIILVLNGEVIMEYKIENDDELIRLDKFLLDKLDVSRSKLQEMIKQGLVLVNDSKKKNSYVLRVNDVINVIGELKIETDVKPENMDLDIVYEDDYLMVINKPSGLVVHPAAGHYNGTLVNGLLAHTNSLSSNNGEVRPGIVHRIDKDTSGLLVIAKDDKTHEELSKQLKDKTLSRIYVALVQGRINHDTGTIDAPIGRDPSDRKKMCVTENGKEAITHFKVLERYKDASLIECKLETGRTHQIRVHMSHIGHPLVGDFLYGGENPTLIDRQALHSYKLAINHPVTGERLVLEAPLPDDFIKVIEKISK